MNVNVNIPPFFSFTIDYKNLKKINYNLLLVTPEITLMSSVMLDELTVSWNGESERR